jgi:hypothetical protein
MAAPRSLLTPRLARYSKQPVMALSVPVGSDNYRNLPVISPCRLAAAASARRYRLSSRPARQTQPGQRLAGQVQAGQRQAGQRQASRAGTPIRPRPLGRRQEQGPAAPASYRPESPRPLQPEDLAAPASHRPESPRPRQPEDPAAPASHRPESRSQPAGSRRPPRPAAGWPGPRQPNPSYPIRLGPGLTWRHSQPLHHVRTWDPYRHSVRPEYPAQTRRSAQTRTLLPGRNLHLVRTLHLVRSCSRARHPSSWAQLPRWPAGMPR